MKSSMVEKLQMTASEWNHIFPTWPNLPDDGKPSTIMNTEYVDVISAVLLTEHWPGIVEPSDDLRQATVFRAGRWCVTDDAIICVGEFGQDYVVGINQLDEPDWFAHLLRKTWLYDPSDMIDAFEAARTHSLPQESQVQREAFIDNQIKIALEEHNVPYIYPSRVLKRHIYLASRMTNEEREAFSQFLADRGFVAHS